MKISIQPFEPEHEPAVAAFNRRMRTGKAPSTFLLPERAKPPVRVGGITVTHHVAVDDTGEVRGGVMCMEHPAIVGGTIRPTINIQAPLSEGIIDPAFMLVGPQLIKHVTRTCPHVFVVGMGGAANPLPRLLKALGWTLHTVPFYFRILHAGRCVRQLAPLRTSRARRLAAAVAAASGGAALGAAVVHRSAPEAKRTAAAFEAQPVTDWNGSDAIWNTFAPQLKFGVLRTAATLPFFYERAGSPQAWWLMRNGRPEGWFGLLVAKMSGNPYFGDLAVATLTDCVGTPDAVRAAPLLAARAALEKGADLVITNQQHRLVREACANAGWRSSASNFLVATSRALSAEYDVDTSYVTRRDGDGLTNLR